MMDLKIYRQVLNSLNEGVYFVDSDRKITFWNKGAAYITGFSADEVTGTFCHQNLLNHVDADGNKLCFQGCPLHATILDQQERSAHVYLHHKAGHRVPVQVKTMPLIDDKDTLIGSIEVFSDQHKPVHHELSKDDLYSIAFTDALTEIPNRRFAEMQLKKLRLELEEAQSPYSIAIVDIDFFKHVNDTHGHDIGDEILRIVAKTLSHSVRSTDVVARWGGEELILILNGLTETSLPQVLEKVRMLVENSVYRSETLELSVTISIGGATAQPDRSPEDLFKQADRNLYLAKHEGRNCVRV